MMYNLYIKVLHRLFYMKLLFIIIISFLLTYQVFPDLAFFKITLSDIAEVLKQYINPLFNILFKVF